MEILTVLVVFFIGGFIIRRLLRGLFGGSQRNPSQRNSRLPNDTGGRQRRDEAWGGIKMESPPPPPTDTATPNPDMPQQHFPLDIPPPDSPERIHVPLDPSQPIQRAPQEASPYRDTFDTPAPQPTRRADTSDQFGGYDPFKDDNSGASNETFGHYEAKADDITRRLQELESYRDQGVISEKEYKQKRWEIMQGKR
jgi:hypothetical protein